jgi:hypothetical protein
VGTDAGAVTDAKGRLREGLDGAVLLLRISAYAQGARWQDARALDLDDDFR